MSRSTISRSKWAVVIRSDGSGVVIDLADHWLGALRPSVALVSAGATNPVGHPAAAALAADEDAPVLHGEQNALEKFFFLKY